MGRNHDPGPDVGPDDATPESILEGRPVVAWLEARRKDGDATTAAGSDLRSWYGSARASAKLSRRRERAVRLRASARPTVSLGRRVAAVAAVAALALPLAAGNATASGRYGAGRTISASEVLGDGFNGGGWRAGPASSSAGRFTGKKLDAGSIQGDGPKDGPRGDPPLVDGSGLRWNVNTNIGFTTSSSASGAVSEGNFTHAVNASTLNGGTINATLVDAFDGYNAMAVHVGANPPNGPVNTANAHFYNFNGPGSLECSGRQVVLPNHVFGDLTMSRKVYVPSGDNFARWANFFTNTGASQLTVTMYTSNNLGSDAGTTITGTSDGDLIAELTDTWVASFQQFSGTTSSDPRLGHVMKGAGAPVGMSKLNFVNTDDNPYWAYTFTLQPSQTRIILNYASGHPTKAAAAAKAAALANAPPLDCLTATEQSQVMNFNLGPVGGKRGCTIVGTSGPDDITGTPGDDVICGGKGNDTLDGAGGNDILWGVSGTDTLVDTDGTDELIGGGGPDSLDVGDGSGGDHMDGGRGVDTCTGDPADTKEHCEP
jgi:hypothetical protein